MKSTLIALSLMAAANLACAQSTPVGLWKTIDDDGKTEKSLLRVTETAGVFTGKVEKIFDPAKATANCEACKDERKGQPVLGLTIIKNVKANTKDNTWDGGEILDPTNGKTYKVRMTPIEAGKKMEVRGFIGISLLGRTQTWIRVE